jgi:hypothetical protein
VAPTSKGRLLCDVFEDHRPFVDESAGGDWALLRIIHGSGSYT